MANKKKNSLMIKNNKDNNRIQQNNRLLEKDLRRN